MYTGLCSDVGKEQDIIGNPHLLQLRRAASRALGHVIGEGRCIALCSCERGAQPSYNKLCP
jgi:hypothetical protein